MATPTGYRTRPAPSRPAEPAGETAAPILTSIVATIGPASEPPETVRRLIDSGVCVFRFNFSHGDFEAHAKRLATVREVARDMGVCVACLGDLQGPKIRVGAIPAGVGQPAPSGGGSVAVEVGQDVVFRKGLEAATIRRGSGGPEPVLPVTHEPLIDEVEPGHRVLINDGAVRMIAVERDAAAGELRCRVTVGGLITSKKGINLPQTRLTAPAITPRDWECVEWALRHGLDYLALSFVRSAADVRELKDHLVRAWDGGKGPWVPVIAKIEMPQAVADLDAIVEASDGIMVARGDLGVEMDISQVPVVQKTILATCARHGKPSIVATQMLETMIENASPTRAEASDVANAIFDGADAVMLSGETATGKHPVLVVETMSRIVAAAERWTREQRPPHQPPTRLAAAHRGTAALAHGAWDMAQDLGAVLVACWSQHGGTARYLSQNRFHIPIVACSSDERSCRQMALYRGVTPVISSPPPSGAISAWNTALDKYLVARGLAKPGDPIILLAGHPLGQAKKTNTVAIHKVGDPAGFAGGVA
jgi:pyruvate kinase